jgi:cation transport ATPase
LSFWKGTWTFGRLEYVCLGLLVVSGLVWILFYAPLVNLAIGLVAYFIGALPTYKRVWRNGSSESVAFWSLFCIASFLSIVDANGASIQDLLFPIYFTLFDGSMTVLSLRKSTNPTNK